MKQEESFFLFLFLFFFVSFSFFLSCLSFSSLSSFFSSWMKMTDHEKKWELERTQFLNVIEVSNATKSLISDRKKFLLTSSSISFLSPSPSLLLIFLLSIFRRNHQCVMIVMMLNYIENVVVVFSLTTALSDRMRLLLTRPWKPEVEIKFYHQSGARTLANEKLYTWSTDGSEIGYSILN